MKEKHRLRQMEKVADEMVRVNKKMIKDAIGDAYMFWRDHRGWKRNTRLAPDHAEISLTLECEMETGADTYVGLSLADKGEHNVKIAARVSVEFSCTSLEDGCLCSIVEVETCFINIGETETALGEDERWHLSLELNEALKNVFCPCDNE